MCFSAALSGIILSVLSKIIGVIGELLLTAGVLVALFAFYLLYWSGLETGKAQDQARDELQKVWSAPASQRASESDGEAHWIPGSAVAMISAPKAGFNNLIVFEGVSQEVLRGGPGHYPGTALPGQVGNSSYAAHRDGHGAPFDNIDRLQTCDDITVETQDSIYHYKVLPHDGMAGVGERFDCVPEGTNVPEIPGQQIVTPDRGDVIEPVGDTTLLTLTTCHPQWDNTHRLIVHAVLAGVEAKEVN